MPQRSRKKPLITKHGSEARATKPPSPTPTLTMYTEIVERHLRKSPRVRKFFIKLTEDNSDGSRLAQLLCRAVWLLAKRPRTIAALRPGFGKKIRTLGNYPKKLKKWATEIDRKTALLFPTFGDLRSQDCARMLRALADDCEKQWQNRKESPSNALRVFDSMGDEALYELVQFVEKKTKKPHYREVADMLSETATALDVDMAVLSHSRSGDFEFNPDWLKVNIDRYRKSSDQK